LLLALTILVVAVVSPAQVTFTEYPGLETGSGYEITRGPDGNLWFSEAGRNNIGRITPAGVITEFPLPSIGIYGPSGSQGGITAGPDGNLWFADYFSNMIGKISPITGDIQEFNIPSPGIWGWIGTFPFGIAAGPDGNIWFTEAYGYRIGRITHTGDFQEFPLTDSPWLITSGPDGDYYRT
jgi:virginiamycin B lyase